MKTDRRGVRDLSSRTYCSGPASLCRLLGVLHVENTAKISCVPPGLISVFARAVGWDRSGTYVIPKACVHKLAKMAGVGGDNNDLRLDAESERLGGNCVFAGARLISSARRKAVNRGPRINVNWFV